MISMSLMLVCWICMSVGPGKPGYDGMDNEADGIKSSRRRRIELASPVEAKSSQPLPAAEISQP